MPRGRVALWIAVMALAASSLGCSSTSTCSRDEDNIKVENGLLNEDETMYVSSDPSAGQPFIYFPANRTITFYPHLHAEPTVNIYLAFSEDPSATLAPAAGNMGLITSESQDAIVVKNDTCSEFWIWLTATASKTPFHRLVDGGIDPAAAGAAGSD
jgi:hypothetical protein